MAFALIAIVILISGFTHFIYVDESESELTKNDSMNGSDKNYRWEPVFAIVGLLAVICYILRGKEKEK